MMHEYDSAVKEIPITNKQDWLENRLLDVTSTEVSALFNVNPYKSQFELYIEKKIRVLLTWKTQSVWHGVADLKSL